MADDDIDSDDEVEDEDPVVLIRQMRKQLKENSKALKETESAKRELALLKAGIDTSTKLGALFARSYDGDLTNVDALKAEWYEVNPSAKPEAGETEDEGDGSAEERSRLASGAAGDDGSGIDGRQIALTEAREAMEKGAPFDKAGGGFVARLAAMAMEGDQRVIVRGNSY